MNNNDFIRLQGLVAKLISATKKAEKVDGTFEKYYQKTIEEVEQIPSTLKQLEQGLHAARILKS